MKKQGNTQDRVVFVRHMAGKVFFSLLVCLLSVVAYLPAQAAVGNGKIVFCSDRDGNEEIYTMNPDGTNQTRVTNNLSVDNTPCFNTDSSKIAFYSKRTGNGDIYVMNADGTGIQRLTTDVGVDSIPSFSPDGSKIAFQSNRDGNFEIYIMDADGSNPTRLTSNSQGNFDPFFSPDGQKIAFSSSRDGNSEIYVMNADGSNQQRLTTNTAFDVHASFSPSGNKILFASTLSGRYDTYMMDSNGANKINLTSLNAITGYSPMFSPDGSKILFASTQNGDYDIYTMNANGSNVSPLTVNTNDDQLPYWGAVNLNSLSITNVSASEGSAANPGSATFTVSLSPAATQTVTVNYATSNGTASAGSDYTAKSGTLTFTPGEISKTITIPFVGDAVSESDETFYMNLSQPAGAALSITQATGTIVNDDAVVPTLTIGDADDASEGNASSAGSAAFTVSLTPVTTQSVTVNYATSNGTASAGSDYTAKSGTLTFAPGEVSKTITVNFIGDTVQEADENFVLTLSQPTKATLGRAQATALILNDDAGEQPLISINDATVTEGNVGNTNAAFAITLSQAGTQTVTVSYAATGLTATAPADFTALSGTVTFAPGETSKNIAIPVRGDTLDETNETFRVSLSNVTNGILNDAQGQGTITDDDAAPSLTIDDVSVFEGNPSSNGAPGTVNATFTIALSAASGQTVTVSAIPSNGTAKAPGDYTSGGASIVFAPGEKSKTFIVPVKGDLLNETDETFYVLLSAPVNASIARGRGIGTIFDDDAAPSITVDGVSIGEGNSGQRVAAFRLKLSAPSGKIVRVSYATNGGTATPNVDYVAVAATPISFNIGSLYTYARVLINGDALNELDESFLVTLTNSVNASIANNQATGVILNDDRAPSLTIEDVSVTEGNSGTTTATFTVSLSAPSGQQVKVNYATADGTARSASDYVAGNATLTFAPGEATKTFAVTLNGDVLVEGDETFYVFLSGALNATVGRARGVGTILNDDSSG